MPVQDRVDGTNKKQLKNHCFSSKIKLIAQYGTFDMIPCAFCMGIRRELYVRYKEEIYDFSR